MSILKRYVLQKFLWTYLVTAMGLIGIFLVIDFFERFDEFFSRNAPISDLLLFYWYRIPHITFYMAPQAVLLATAITLSTLARDNEVMAMRACGIGITGITLPIVGASVVIALLILACNEYVRPAASKKMNHIFYVKVRHKMQYGAVKTDQIWLKTKYGSIWNIERYDPDENQMFRVRIFLTNERNFVEKRIDAKEAKWIENKWRFKDGSYRTFEEKGLQLTEYFEDRFFPLREVPEDFEKIRIKPGELSLSEMYQSIQVKTTEGKDMTDKWVDLHFKISYPFISIVLALLAIPLSLKSSRHGGALFALGVNLGMGFFFSFIYAMGISLGHSGAFGPLLAAWGPNLLFMALGFYLMLTLDSEYILPWAIGNKRI